MRKKLLSVVLILAMTLALVPFSALAEDDSAKTDDKLQGTVEQLTPALTKDEDETITDSSGGTVSVIEVSVTPGRVQFSKANENGRTDGWWAGIKIIAPADINVDQVQFRNMTNCEDKLWKDFADGDDLSYMEAWNGVTQAHLEKGMTSLKMSWYFNWDGDDATGITVTGDNFYKGGSKAETPAYDMRGVDQIINFTLKLTDKVELVDEDGKLVWPAVQAITPRTTGAEDNNPNADYGAAYETAGLSLSRPSDGVYTLTIDKKKLEAVVEAGRDNATFKVLENDNNPYQLWFGMEYAVPEYLEDEVREKIHHASVRFDDSSSYTDIELSELGAGNGKGFYNYIKVYGANRENGENGVYAETGPGETAVIKWLDADGKVLAVTKAVVEINVNTESGGDSEDVTYTITFNSNGGSAVAEQKVKANQRVTKPNDPAKGGYTFGGWYKDSECTEPWNFDETSVTGNLTLYAKWTQSGGDGSEPGDDDGSEPGDDGSEPGDDGSEPGDDGSEPGDDDGSEPGGDDNKPDEPKPDTYEISIRSGIRHGSVYVSDWYAEPGDRVTITVDPDSDYVVDWVEAVRESSGYSLYLTRSGKRYTFTMPVSDVIIDVRFRLQYSYSYSYYQFIEPVQPVEAKPVFTPLTWRSAAAAGDVSAYSWAYSPAQWAYQNGYLDLAGDGSFRLDGPVSHQQMWRIMAQWLGEPGMSDWELTNWAMKNGAAKGSPAGSSMTRQDLVTYLYQCYFLMGGDVSVTGNLGSYADSRLITSIPVRNAWTWAVEKGIISGTADGYLNPGSAVSRGEFAAILMRLCQNA